MIDSGQTPTRGDFQGLQTHRSTRLSGTPIHTCRLHSQGPRRQQWQTAGIDAVSTVHHQIFRLLKGMHVGIIITLHCPLRGFSKSGNTSFAYAGGLFLDNILGASSAVLVNVVVHSCSAGDGAAQQRVEAFLSSVNATRDAQRASSCLLKLGAHGWACHVLRPLFLLLWPSHAAMCRRPIQGRRIRKIQPHENQNGILTSRVV